MERWWKLRGGIEDEGCLSDPDPGVPQDAMPSSYLSLFDGRWSSEVPAVLQAD